MTDDRSEKRKQSKSEVSAGGIVYKKDLGKIFVLLIMPAPRESAAREAFRPVWTWPKGWVGDHGEETIEQSALREVREEGGVEAKIVQNLGEVKYFFRWQEENIYKIVRYFLMEYVSGDPADHDHEVDEAGWFTLEDAESKLTYETDKEVFEKAKQYL